MKTAAAALVYALAAWSVAAAGVELKIITPKGYVAFSAADHWSVLELQTKMPVAAAVFQLPNAADEGTPDSTNLVLLLWERGSEKESTVYGAPVTQYGSVAPISESFEDWKVFRQEARQGETLYSIWDARKSGVADVSVSVRLAWPHLPNNPADYAGEMERTFRAFLTSVSGRLGKYERREGEVVRRPANRAASGAER